MSHPHTPETFGAAYWEDRYQVGEGTGRHVPSPSLVEEAAQLPPGRALDAGCGRGADALWLARRGWHVTAVDISATALAAAADSTRGTELQDRVDWVRADLGTWQPHRDFDLVTSHYVHAPGPQRDFLRRLSSWVAPGGTLLVVGHADTDGEDHRPHGEFERARPPATQVSPEQVTALLPTDDWEVLVAERRTQHLQRPDGSGTTPLHATIVRARRRGAPPGSRRGRGRPTS